MAMPDDLDMWSRIVRTVAEERRERIAGTLSVAAIIMLLITSVTVANRGEMDADTQEEPKEHTGLPTGKPTDTAPAVSAQNAADGQSTGPIMWAGRSDHRASAEGANANLRGPSVAPLDCPRLRGREWLTGSIIHRGDVEALRVECRYGGGK